jgi:phytoene dehydrogenase-like protein
MNQADEPVPAPVHIVLFQHQKNRRPRHSLIEGGSGARREPSEIAPVASRRFILRLAYFPVAQHDPDDERQARRDGAVMAYDAIVVGAGHNGLAAAIHLAAKGWKVAVFERNATAGGAVQTREVTLPGFRHDLFAMNLSLFAGSPFVAAYGAPLARHGLAFAPAVDTFATAFPDGSWFGVSADLETTATRADALNAEDGRKWREMVAAFAGDAPHLFGVLGSAMPSFALAKVLFKAWRARGLNWLLDTLRLAISSPREFLDRNFHNDKIKAAVAAWGMHLDFPPDAAGGALFPYLEAMANQSFGMALGKGGADVMIRAMTGLLAELGGELRLGAEVARIEVAGGRANGVTLTDGRSFAANRTVIANVEPRLLFDRLLAAGSGQPDVDRRMRAFRHGPGTMMIHLAMDALPEWRAGAALQRFAYIHLAPDFATMAKAYGEALDGLAPAEPVIVVGQPTAIDPTRAPDGKHILWLQVRALPAEVKGDAAGKIAPGDWDVVKEAYADRVIAILERYAPGLGNRILGRAVLSPKDLERENPNLIGGDSIAGSHHLDQYFLFRPIAGWSRYRTPVRGLYMVGASTWPGAGLGAGSGFILGKILVGDPPAYPPER